MILCHWTLGIDCVVTSVLCVRLCLNASILPFPLLPPALPFIPHRSPQSPLHTCVYSCTQTESPSTVTCVYVLRADHWALDKCAFLWGAQVSYSPLSSVACDSLCRVEAPRLSLMQFGMFVGVLCGWSCWWGFTVELVTLLGDTVSRHSPWPSGS